MARRRSAARSVTRSNALFKDDGLSDTSLLDVVDNVLNNGVVLHGELLLGVANVDLIYLKLSMLLAAVDRVAEPPTSVGSSPVRRHKRP